MTKKRNYYTVPKCLPIEVKDKLAPCITLETAAIEWKLTQAQLTS